MQFLSGLILCSCSLVIVNCYSIGYFTKSTGHINGNTMMMSHYPTVYQIADIYSRLGGLPPLLQEDQYDIPSRNMLEAFEIPLILEVRGGVFPSKVIAIAQVENNIKDRQVPSVESVLEVLSSHNIQPINHIISGNYKQVEDEVQSFLQAQNAPVVIIHYESTHLQRSLTLSNSSSVPVLTEFQISQYQICLWTGVVMFLLVLAAICSIANMEVVPDSLLFAKYQSSRTNKSD